MAYRSSRCGRKIERPSSGRRYSAGTSTGSGTVSTTGDTSTPWPDTADSTHETDDGDTANQIDELGAAAAVTAQARERWEPVVDAWTAQFERAAIPDRGLVDDEPDQAPADPANVTTALAVELDDWLQRHHEPHDPGTPARPVTALLARMDPWCELMHLAAVRGRLHDTPDHTAAGATLDQRAARVRAGLGDPVTGP